VTNANDDLLAAVLDGPFKIGMNLHTGFLCELQ
jgi:hypothetical protein